MPKKEYNVRVELYGFGAYAVDRLLETGLYRTTKAGVVEEIVSRWISEHLRDLDEAHGLNIPDATEKEYIPIKIKNSNTKPKKKK